MADVEVAETIGSAPEQVYALVTDLPRMGEWSPENTGGRWLDGSTSAGVGARFRGTNKHGPLRWSTTVTVTAADPGRRFAFDVHYTNVPISTWEYEIADADGGCLVTERWTDRRPSWMRVLSVPVMWVADRGEHNRAGMQHTLRQLKTAAEASGK